ncbi:hypothetical protein NUH88_00185 [Nisaea acidiphila]|uniref:Uncharacterized protein n=1 Tax=Nisaea acidiphila TaxID=1862145 RepID=A0A9J7AS87_9PROT|nr:hypothetical protein [Nisaea acidiphila]UUX50127.1 hypothetical protein NUH88_00185 [Nisaea acidiphila]
MDERKKLLLMMREIRKKIDPKVLERAHQAALIQMGEKPAPLRDNEASRLFKLARADNGARKSEVLAFLEKKFRNKLN